MPGWRRSWRISLGRCSRGWAGWASAGRLVEGISGLVMQYHRIQRLSGLATGVLYPRVARKLGNPGLDDGTPSAFPAGTRPGVVWTGIVGELRRRRHW